MRPNSTQYRPKIDIYLDGELEAASTAFRVYLAEGETIKIVDGRPVSIAEAIETYTITEDSGQIRNTAAKTTYDQDLSVGRAPATGDKFSLRVTGELEDRGSSDTATLSLSFAGESFSLAAFTLGGSAETFHLEFDITVRDGEVEDDTTFWIALVKGFYGTTPLRPLTNTYTGVDFTPSWTVSMAVQFSYADNSNASILENMTLEHNRS